ncbi:mechanosensitive ion channel family protein [Cyanobium sp. ATX 6A2]|uniref:mechanosensitive ion channel family protein n=1 Tax=Cyanobium sp. ATX 6A2 TaxID=2823700 RepID=UPI0020CE36EC|nr:mechanosensitive ion channel family protein [Cyanobium sp. ATX 6A2]MCP9887448.1 mechanosensitive ion channel family protein [Cyanobium sp. ATX 6A2]
MPIAQLNSSVFTDLFTDLTLAKLLRAAIAIGIAYGGMWLVEVSTTWASEKVARRFRMLIKQSLPLWKAIILITTISYLLQQFLKLSQTNLLAITGTIAIALAFALKDYVSSIIAGIVALFEAPYRVGDRIQIGDHYGEMVGYGLRAIQLHTPDDNIVTIPHNKTWTEAIANANTGALEAQVATDFYFDHQIESDIVITILRQAAYSSPYTQLRLPVTVIMREYPWGTQFKLRCYPLDIRDEFTYRTDLIRRSKQAFRRHGLAYPNLPAGWPGIRGESGSERDG